MRCANCDRESEYDCCSDFCSKRYRLLCALRSQAGALRSLIVRHRYFGRMVDAVAEEMARAVEPEEE